VQQSNFNFLFWRLSGRTLGDVIAVTHPAGAQKYFIKHSRGKRSGRDYQALVTEVVNGMLSFYTNAPIGLMNEGNGNPGDSFMGSAKTTEVNFEAEMDRADARNAKFSKPYLNISTRWKGWSISAKKAKKILDKINQQFTRPLVSPMALGTTTKLQLYTINLEMNFYSRAVEAAIAADKKRLQAAYHRYAEFEDLTYISYMPGDGLSHGGFRERYTRAEQISSAISRVARYQKKFTQNLAKGRVDKAAKYGAKLFSYIQENLQFAGVAEICGGTEHLYVTAQLRGFRKGDENGDMPYVSDSLGNFGDAHLTGPLASMKNSIGLTDAEFYAYWMMGVF
jgi:hypothetical protein